MSNIASGSNSAPGINSLQLDDHNGVLYLEQLDTGVSGSIVVMICRMWDVNTTTGRYLSTDFVVCDAKGKTIHCTARSNIAHNFVGLKEGSVYSIKNFTVQQNKDEYRIIRQDPFMIEFDGSTRTRKVSVNTDGFNRYPFELAEFDDIEPTNNKYYIDVAGYVANVGRTTHQKSGSRTLDFYLANKRGQSIRVTLWGGLGDILIEQKTKNVGLCPVVITALNVKDYNNRIYLSSSSSTMIYANDDIPALIDLKVDMSSVELNKAIVPVELSEAKDGTLENLLIWGRNKRNNSMVYNCKVTIDNVRTRKGWNYPSCGDNKCKKGATRKGGRFWCDGCERQIEYPILRFRLELDLSDHTAQTVVVLFDETVRELLKCSPESLLDHGPEEDGASNLPRAISALIGTSHILVLRSHTYFEHGPYESFTCWKIHQTGALTCTHENETGSSSPASPVMKKLSKKSLSNDPSVPTPMKLVEGKKKKSMEYEDSEPELAYAEEAGSENGSSLGKIKRRRYIESGSKEEEEGISQKVEPAKASATNEEATS